jgi:hypothetical protein
VPVPEGIRPRQPRPPPGNVYLREADVLPAIDRWLTVIFAPHRLTQTIAEWTRQVKAERAAALARDASQQARSKPSRRLTEDDIRALITTLGNLRDVIRDATPAEKAAIYDQFDLKITFKPGEAKIRAEVTIGPENYAEHAEQCGDTGRVRGPSARKSQYVLSAEFALHGQR